MAPRTINLSKTADADLPTFTPPSFTTKDLLSSIPAHCFERSAARSFSYIAKDFLFLALFAYLASFIDSSVPRALGGGLLGEAARWTAWGVYWWYAALAATGVWVIAHECGHQAFSPSMALNNAVGFVLHSALLVPYHAWRITHAKHHAATGDLGRDMVHLPATRSQVAPHSKPSTATASDDKEESLFEKVDELLEDAPIWTFITMVGQQLFGWPLYILFNVSGQKYPGRWVNHFDPSSPLFGSHHRWQIIASNLGLAVTLAALYLWGANRGFGEVVKFYFIPYLGVNHWLVLITYLQHTDPYVPYYRSGEWNFQRGALCTIDRNIHGWWLHGIAETHVAHHVCSKIPHYNAWEATDALKKKLGSYYMKTDENFWVSLWKAHSECKFIEDEGDVLFYKNRFGQAKIKVALDTATDSGVDVQ